MNQPPPQNHQFIDSAIPRRSFIRRSALLIGASATLSVIPRRAQAAEAPVMVNLLRTLTNPYEATWNKGGQAFAKAIGASYVTLVNEGDSEKGIADLRAILAKTRGNMCLTCNPNDSPDSRPIVEACAKAGAYVVTQWNKPADLHPWDFDPFYVSHILFDGIRYGQETANALVNAMGGSGGIVALGGIISNTPAIERKAGLEKALKAKPEVELLDFQVANWKSTEAFPIVSAWLTRFGDKIKGIWAANDDMGVGAVEALRAEGLAGKIPVTGTDGTEVAVDAVRKGEFAATVSWDPYWQGSMGLSIAYGAKIGKFDPSKEPHEHREFYGQGTLVTKENADEFYKTHITSEPVLDWNDYWGRVTGQIRAA